MLITLPDELIQTLSRFLHLPEFLCLSTTCHRNHSLLNSHSGWLYQLEQLIPDLKHLENAAQLVALARRDPRSWRMIFYALGFQSRQLSSSPFIPNKFPAVNRARFHTGWDFTAKHPRDPLSRLRKANTGYSQLYIPRLHLHGVDGLVVLSGTTIHCIHPDGVRITYVDPQVGKQRYATTRLQWIEEFVKHWVPSVRYSQKAVEGEDKNLMFSGWYPSQYDLCSYDYKTEGWRFVHAENSENIWQIQGAAGHSNVAISLLSGSGEGVTLRIEVVTDVERGMFWLKLKR